MFSYFLISPNLAKNSYELSSLEQHHKIAKDKKKKTQICKCFGNPA
jgi:hypothetical protein